jgi:hypothetical protein
MRTRRADRWRRPVGRALLLAVATLSTLPAPTQAQSTTPIPGWASDPRPDQPAPPPALRGTQGDPPGSATTSTVPRPIGPTEARTSGLVTFRAHVTDEGPPLDQGVIWRIYLDKPGPDGRYRLVSQHRDATPQLRLDAGEYWVNVAYGRANLTRRVTVTPGRVAAERFVINAGALKVSATLASGEAAADNQVALTIYSDERDASGNRIVVLSGARPGILIRLNAGVYQVQSLYGDANAVTRGDITVEPGKLTEATIVHPAARATLKLVTQPGGDALADTVWTIVGSQGETIKETAGALPSHAFAPGVYGVIARRQGQTWRRDIQLQPGEAVLVEVLAN